MKILICGGCALVKLSKVQLTEIKRQANRGEAPRFVKYGSGLFGLRKWMGEGLAYQIEHYNREVRKKFLAHLQNMTATLLSAK